MNANGFRDKLAKKIDQMIEFCNNNKICVAMLSETNVKRKTRTADMMSSKMKELGREKGAIMKIAKHVK